MSLVLAKPVNGSAPVAANRNPPFAGTQIGRPHRNVDTGGEFRVHYLFTDPRLCRSALAGTFNLADERRDRLGSKVAEFATSVNVGSLPCRPVRSFLPP
jgi:hypothetical protein